MTRMRSLCLLALVPIVALAVVAVFSKRKYGYWLERPAVSRVTDRLATVERFTSVIPDGRVHSGAEALRDTRGIDKIGSLTFHRSAEHCPMVRIACELVARGLEPTTPGAAAASHGQEARRRLKDLRVL